MKRFIILFSCFFLLSSCSTKLAYNYLDIILKWKIGKYVTLNRKQKKFVDINIDEFHRWHRQSQLPRYSDYIQGVIERISTKEMNGELIHAETDEVQLLIDSSFEYLKPSIAELISSFDEKQSQQLLENFAKDRKKYHKKYVATKIERLYKKRADELTDNISPFFGKLTEEQKQWINAWSKNLQPYEALSLKQQETWGEHLKEALALRKDREALLEKLDQVMFYRTDDWDPELERILDHNQEITYSLLANLVNNQTPKQREKMFRKLNKYRTDFEALSQGE